MKKIVFNIAADEKLKVEFISALKAEEGILTMQEFPDGETYVRVGSDVKDKEIIVICTLDRPDRKIMPLYFLCKTLRELGAGKIVLIAPYLAYMRQDKRFKDGEAVTSRIFAGLISECIDEIYTVDAHLHRFKELGDLYSVTGRNLHASAAIASYIAHHIKEPVLIGPDSESKQWVKEVAELAGAPYLILEKERLGDRKVNITVPDLDRFPMKNPVIIDDIISTAQTMIATVKHLVRLNMNPPICIGVHAIFSDDAEKELRASGALDVVTCNTISHPTNRIDITPLLLEAFL
jgi:ribose-phosphate pyrophosphokinase